MKIKIGNDTFQSWLNMAFTSLNQYILSNMRTKEFKKIPRNVTQLVKTTYMGYPKVIYIEPCNICNLRCPLCTQPPTSNERPNRMMSYAELVKIVDNIKGVGWRIFFGMGGEPLLNPDIFRMISYTNRNSFYTILSTNGVLLDDKRIQKLFDSQLDRLLLSFDGITTESYSKMRNGAKFEQVLGNIKKTCEYKKTHKNIKPAIEVNFIVTRYSEPEIEDAKRMAAEWGVDRFNLRPLTVPETVFKKEEHESICREYLPLNPALRKKRYSEMYYEPNNECNWHTRSPAILADGRMVLCCTDYKGQYVLGDVLNNGFRDIWFGKKAMKLREKGRLKSLPICKSCFPDD